MTTTPLERKKAPQAPAPWTVLVVFLLITVLATKYVWDSSRLADRARFTSAVQATRDTIGFRIETYTNVLRAATGLFAANRAATRDEFRAYVQHLRVQQRYPGIQGIGLSLRVRADELPAVVADLRSNEFPDFHIFPENPPRSEYHAIVALEPLDTRNRAAIGYDMHTSPSRRDAMDRARDSGEAASTAVVTLIQEIDAKKSPGFLIYVPIYRVPMLPAGEDRRTQLYGFVYAPFRATDLFRNTVTGNEHPEVRYVIFDGPDLLYDSHPRFTGTPRFSSVVTIPVAGRTWTVRFASERTGLGAPALVAAATFLVGITISVLLFTLLRLQALARANAERIAERLRRSEAELHQANRAKDEFLATLSHELRTPMTAILGWSELLAGKLDDETRDAAIDSIQKSGRAQAQLIDDLLDVSRITAGKMRIDPHLLDLVAIVNAAVDAVMPASDAKGVALRRNLPNAPLRVNADANRLQQVVWNLLTNAVKFTPAGGSVVVDVNADTSDAFISVTDTGQGIDPEFLPHVFERFRQADSSTTRSYTGLGLGLAIVRHLVELHGGTVKAESKGLRQGARFIVRLPLAVKATAPVAADDPADHAIRNTLDGVRLLIVDDEETMRGYAATVFRMSGAEVVLASSASEALELLSSNNVDLVITDIGMPEMDGYALLDAIRSSSKARIPVIALTAYARPEDRDLIEQAGFDGLVTKPVEPAQLRIAVANVLARAV